MSSFLELEITTLAGVDELDNHFLFSFERDDHKKDSWEGLDTGSMEPGEDARQSPLPVFCWDDETLTKTA